MIKFKEFNVGDADYKEQMEQFQTEHQNAEFLQITGGHMSYEKIWFKYEPSDISDSTDKLSVEKLQEQLNTAKKALTEAIEDIEQLNGSDDTIKYYKQELAVIGGDDEC